MRTNNPSSDSQDFSGSDEESTTSAESTISNNNVSRGSPHAEASNSHIPVPTNDQPGLNSDRTAFKNNPTGRQIQSEMKRQEIDLNSLPPSDPETDSDLALSLYPQIASTRANPYDGASLQDRPGVGPHNVSTAASNSSQLVASTTGQLGQATAYTSDPTVGPMRPEASQSGLDVKSVSLRDPGTYSASALNDLIRREASYLPPHLITVGENPSQQHRAGVGPHNVSSATSNPSQLFDSKTGGLRSMSNYDEPGMFKRQKLNSVKLYNSNSLGNIVEPPRTGVNPLAFAPNASTIVSPTFTENEIQLTSASEGSKTNCACMILKCLRGRCRCLNAQVGCSRECVCCDCQNSYGKRQDQSTNGNKDLPDSSTSNQTQDKIQK